jgi:hypothetical protein
MSAGRSDLPRGRGLSVSLAAEFARALLSSTQTAQR